MPDADGELSGSKGFTRERFRHLPDPVALADTVESVPSEVAPEPAGQRNAFIDAAVRAGG